MMVEGQLLESFVMLEKEEGKEEEREKSERLEREEEGRNE